MEEPRNPWDKRPRESAKAYEFFRRFRDLGPLRTFEPLVDPEHSVSLQTIRTWSLRNDWKDRALAWDEEVHRAEDLSRLEAIRGMHDRHQRAGRLAQAKAIAALSEVQPEDIPPYAAARLLELGARLERDTLIVSVEELQGRTPAAPEDPWEQVARELDQQPLP
jgi:hypothetical protein